MNKEIEICGVKVFVSGETYNEYKGTLEEKDKEIKELNNLLHKANDEVVSYANECIRLNNIIDELEKDLLEKQEFYRNELSTRPTNDSEHNTKFADRCALAQIDVILDKLKELKEGK